MMFLSSTEPHTDIWQRSKNVIELIGNVETLYGVVAFAVMAILFVGSILLFKKRVNELSLQQIASFKRAKKYMPELFTELNDDLESLRFFVFTKRWRKRIVREYNRQFKNAKGREIAKIISRDVLMRRLPIGVSLYDLMDAINKRRSILESLKNDTQTNREKYGQKSFFIKEYIYFLPEKLSEMHEKCELINANSLVLVGSAGNGKTNLLCNLVQNIINNKMPCLFINSRDIDCDCIDYVIGKLMPKRLKQFHQCFLSIVSGLLLLANKHFFIVIDAINENDSDIFATSIGKLMDVLSKHKRIKIICSCRSEYFDARYRRFFEKCTGKPYIFNLQQVEYNDRAKEKMMLLYRKHYGVDVPLSDNVRDRLMHSLLLMRLFFEVNEGRRGENLDLCDAEIYKAYFEKVHQDVAPFDFRSKVDSIAKLMIERNNFKEVLLEDLMLSTEDMDRFKRVLDDNLIISRTVLEGKGITERKVQYVYFVFDELRDFCLARFLLTQEEGMQDETYQVFFVFVDQLYIQKLSPLEGILKYSYYYFRKIQREDLCKKILDMFSDYSPSFGELDRWDRHQLRAFSNFGLSLVFQAASDLQEFELEYLVNCIVKEPMTFWEVFRFLFRNEFAGAIPDTTLTTALILQRIPYESVQRIVGDFLADRNSRYCYKNEPRAIENLCKAVDTFMRHKGNLPVHMKAFLVVLAALEPKEFALSEFKPYIEEVLSWIDIKSCNAELLQDILELKKRHDSIVALASESSFESLLGGGL